MSIDSKIESVMDSLIDEMHDSESYSNYVKARRAVKCDMRAREAVVRTRSIREELSRMSEADRDSEYAERLVEEYDNLMDITLVHEFSLAELELCNMYQDVMARIAGSFELGFEG